MTNPEYNLSGRTHMNDHIRAVATTLTRVGQTIEAQGRYVRRRDSKRG